MPRRLRIKFEDAVHHGMARGNARQYIGHDDDRRRLLAYLERVWSMIDVDRDLGRETLLLGCLIL